MTSSEVQLSNTVIIVIQQNISGGSQDQTDVTKAIPAKIHTGN